MSDQNNSSFAHAFLPGLILGLIIGAVAGAFVPDMMGGPKIKPAPSSSHTTGEPHPRDNQGTPEIDPETQALIDEAEKASQDAIDENLDAIEDTANDAVNDAIDDAKELLPESP